MLSSIWFVYYDLDISSYSVCSYYRNSKSEGLSHQDEFPS